MLTAFIVETYPALQPPPPDPSAQILLQISAQLNSFYINGGTINSSHPVLTVPAIVVPQPSSSTIVINTLWFSSLICSLAAASIGILLKQWLNHLASRVTSPSRQSARIRQYRHAGFKKWKVVQMMTLLPVLLQLALALFLIGLVELLWTFERAVAIIATILVTALLLFSLVTAVLPAIWGDCPYKSPQAWWFFCFFQQVKILSARPAGYLRKKLWPILYLLYSSRFTIVSSVAGAIRRWFSQLADKRVYTNWKEREHVLVRSLKRDIDATVLAMADATIMDDDFLETVVRPCLQDVQVEVALPCFYDILAYRADAFVDNLPSWNYSAHGEHAIGTMTHLALDMLSKITPQDRDSDKHLDHILSLLDRLLKVHASPGGVHHRTLTVLSGLLIDAGLPPQFNAQTLLLIQELARRELVESPSYDSTLTTCSLLTQAKHRVKICRSSVHNQIRNTFRYRPFRRAHLLRCV